MKAVILDAETLGENVNLSPLENQLNELTCYDRTAPKQVIDRLTGIDIAISNKVILNEETLAKLPDLKLICVFQP